MDYWFLGTKNMKTLNFMGPSQGVSIYLINMGNLVLTNYIPVVLVYGLFENTVSISAYTALNDSMKWLMNWKEFGSSVQRLIKVLSYDWVWPETGFGLVISFTEHLQNVTINNYDSLTERDTPKVTVTTTHMKSSQSSLAVAW
jgi:hypothetical protein